jgi:hypothetical protein
MVSWAKKWPFWCVLCLLAVSWAGAQNWRPFEIEPNVTYDGRFTFARIRYTVYRRSGWEFDYPVMERNLMTMMQEVTSLAPHVAGSNVHTFDDPELLKYPVAYLSEPGYWIPSEAEVLGLRNYLAKGGFLVVDDFMRASGPTSSAACSACFPARASSRWTSRIRCSTRSSASTPW